jgi:quercetin dioxygenase-like cupin family protein
MDVRSRGRYEIQDRELVAEGADLRVQVLTLAPGQCVPWHYHSEITDSFVGLEGQTVIETTEAGEMMLRPGERFAVGPGIPHTVYGSSDNPCKFMVIQGVGAYDYVPVSR